MKHNIFLGWWQVLACMLLQATSVATISLAFSVVAVPLGEAFNASRMVVMLAMTSAALGLGLLSPVFGPMLDRYPLRRLLVAGAVLLAGGFLAVSFATSMIHVVIVYGVLLAPANVLLGPLASSVLLSRWFVKKRGAALGIAAAGVSLGGFFFPPIVQGLVDAFEWRDAFRVLSILTLLCTVPAILLVVGRPADRNLHPDGDSQELAAAGKSEGAQYGSTGAIMSDPTFWLIAALIGVIFFGTKGWVTNVVHLAIDAGARSDRAALLISMFAGTGLLGKFLFAAMADRLEPRLILGASLVAFMTGMFCYWLAEMGYWLMAIGSLAMGLSVGGVVPLLPFLLARSFGQPNVGRVGGLIFFATTPLNLIAPPLFGLISDRTGSYDLALLLFIAMSIGAILAVPGIRTHPKPSADAAGSSAVREPSP